MITLLIIQMPKTKYGLWSEEDVDCAIDSLRNGDAWIYEMCKNQQ